MAVELLDHHIAVLEQLFAYRTHALARHIDMRQGRNKLRETGEISDHTPHTASFGIHADAGDDRVAHRVTDQGIGLLHERAPFFRRADSGRLPNAVGCTSSTHAWRGYPLLADCRNAKAATP